MTHKVGPKGQVVIPKRLREQLGLQPGDEVTFWLDGDHVVVDPVRSDRPLHGRFAGHDLTLMLERERAADDRRDAAR